MSERPRDEITGKVVAKQYGRDHVTHSGGVFCLFNDEDVGKHYPATATSKETYFLKNSGLYIDKDPRDDTDAALELLWFLDDISTFEIIADVRGDQTGWSVRKWDGIPMPFIPISGQPFRYAVVALAAKVLGVDE